MTNTTALDLDRQRAEFEAWYTFGDDNTRAVERKGETYKLMQAASAWTVWQAAERAIACRSQPVEAAREEQPDCHAWKISDAVEAAQSIKDYPAWPRLPQRVQAEVQVVIDVLARVQAVTEPVAAREGQQEPVAFCAPDAQGKPLFRKGWMFSPIQNDQATMPLYAAPVAQQSEPVTRVDEGDDGMFVEILYGTDGSPLKLGDNLYLHPPVAQHAESGALPTLPEPEIEGSKMHPELKICFRAPLHFTAEQMEAYALAAQSHGAQAVTEPVGEVKLGAHGKLIDWYSSEFDLFAMSVGTKLYAAPVAQQSEACVCTAPPEGWICTRAPGHEGPCAAVPVTEDGYTEKEEAAYQRGLEDGKCIERGMKRYHLGIASQPTEAGAPTAAVDPRHASLEAAQKQLEGAQARRAKREERLAGRESAAPAAPVREGVGEQDAKRLFRTDDFGVQWEVTPKQAAHIEVMQKGAQNK